MNNNSLVSAIIIFLNGEAFIEEAIASIFAQTYEHWELLLVDDGSTDASTAIAQKYAQQYPEKVRYLEHPGHQNRGMSASRNLGICHARGNYIGFLDADDIWLPQKLEQQLHIFNHCPEAAMVYGRTQIWYSWSDQTNRKAQDHFYELGVRPNCLIQPPTLFKQLLNNKYQTPTTCNALIRREVFDTVGQFEESFRTMYEDQVFFSKVTLHVPIYVADACWAKYRQHPQSCSVKSEKYSYYTMRQPFLTWLEQYLKTQPIQDVELFQRVERELWQCHHPRAAHLLNRIQHYSERIQSLFKRSWLSSTQPLR
jgi:glycosyltransferase involved in cell wall biosynthesis